MTFGEKLNLPSKGKDQQPTTPFKNLWPFNGYSERMVTLCIYAVLFNFSKSQMSNLHMTILKISTDILEFLTFHIFGKIVMKRYELNSEKLIKK